MADLERERFEEDVPVRSVSEMPSNLRPSESVDRRQSLPADLNKKIEKSKVKPRLSEGGNLEKERDGERHEKSASPRKPASPRPKDLPAAAQPAQAHGHQINTTQPLYLQLIDKARWTDFLHGVVDNVKSTPKPAFNSNQIVVNLKRYWLNYYAIFLGLLLLFAFSRKLLFIPLLINGAGLAFHNRIPIAVEPSIIVAGLWLFTSMLSRAMDVLLPFFLSDVIAVALSVTHAWLRSPRERTN
eukprot:TRINITY_DN355_c0_g1_i1.p1 TRINITY_DN355_c0_g1~~TRINITY_DN355_c0_g1_i1.p1  ORF type:complete len:264 (-),score=13.79 TRINITY_DN355_c0_g1_i1:212-937(-)